jgi:hypothetical protein
MAEVEFRSPTSAVLSSAVDQIVTITQAAYTALATKDARTLYLIIG